MTDIERTNEGDAEYVGVKAIQFEAELLEHALARDPQRGQHRRVQGGGEVEGIRGIVEFIHLPYAARMFLSPECNVRFY